ncbi:MAG: ImmA/IrrE family metallo-endopeptidase [Spirochaetaceae bacterium]|nr:ImmA/IrrE family metallo-endopeptidase [Spirochaetaceae bacterium]
MNKIYIDSLRTKVNNAISIHDNYGFNSEESKAARSEVIAEFNNVFGTYLNDAILLSYKHSLEQLISDMTDSLALINYEYINNVDVAVRATIRPIGINKYHIIVNGTLSKVERRVAVAHELGHLLISVLNGEIYNNIIRTFPKNREYVASFLGLIMIMKQSIFYQDGIEEFIIDDNEKLLRLSELIFLKYNN